MMINSIEITQTEERSFLAKLISNILWNRFNINWFWNIVIFQYLEKWWIWSKAEYCIIPILVHFYFDSIYLRLKCSRGEIWSFSWSRIKWYLSEIHETPRWYIFQHLVKPKILCCKLSLQNKTRMKPSFIIIYSVVIAKDNLARYQIRVFKSKYSYTVFHSGQYPLF